MAGEDGSIRIDTKIDEAGLDKGLASVTKKLKSGAKGSDAFVGSLAKVGITGAAASLALKKAVDVVDDLTAAYKTQYRAETQLEQAAKNNPYLNDLAVQQLKDYAGQMQQLAGVGDEALLPFMAQLAAAGRTQEQIQEILRVSLDVAASGSMSLDSAVKSLNKTYGGLAGELGETVPELRSLTQEQLRQGGAVKLLSDRYKGMAAEVTKNVGTADQLANAFGDLKEQLGKPFEQGLAPMRGFFTGIVTGWTESLKKLGEYKKAQKDLANNPDNINAQLVVEKKRLSDINKEYSAVAKLSYAESQAYGVTSASIKGQLADLLKKRETQAEIVAGLEAQIRRTDELSRAEQGAAGERAKAEERNAKAADHIAKVNAEREKAVQKIVLQADAEGREADQLEIINAYVASYVAMVGESGGLISANNAAAKELLATIVAMTKEHGTFLSQQATDEEQKKRLKASADELAASMRSALSDVEEVNKSASDRMKDQLAALDDMWQQVIDNEQVTAQEQIDIYREYAEKRKILAEQITDTERLEAEERKRIAKETAEKEHEERYKKQIEILENVNDFATQYQAIMSSLQKLATDRIEAEASVKTAKLQEQYEAGAISAEEYEAKLAEIEKRAAEEKYKIDMWMWSANILSAVSNTALAAIRALTDGGPFMGPLLAAMISAAGGIQLATIVANKPIPPSFATGGIVPGTSYTGDLVASKLNSGEMVWNIAQQKALWDKVQSGDWGGDGSRVQVYNSAANLVKAEPEFTEDGIRIMVRKAVAQDMAEGRFNRSYRTMQNGIRGTRYTN